MIFHIQYNMLNNLISRHRHIKLKSAASHIIQNPQRSPLCRLSGDTTLEMEHRGSVWVVWCMQDCQPGQDGRVMWQTAAPATAAHVKQHPALLIQHISDPPANQPTMIELPFFPLKTKKQSLTMFNCFFVSIYYEFLWCVSVIL